MKIKDKILNKFKAKKYPWDKFYNGARAQVPNMSLYEYLHENNRDNLDKEAIDYLGNRITFREFFRKIDICAKSLRSLGVRSGDVVSVCMPNTPEAVIAFYAISKIGAISNLIHPLSAEEEIKLTLKSTKSVMLICINIAYKNIANIIHDTDVYKVVIVSPKDSMPLTLKIGYALLNDRKIKLPKNSMEFISWQTFMNYGLNYNNSVLVKTTKDQPAVILHSGGTTGKPKNILLNNGNINVVVGQAQIMLPKSDSSDKMLSILPMFHCFGLVETIHFPLCTGASIVLVPKFDATKFDKLLTKHRPTIIPGVPTLFEALISNKRMEKVDLSNVKYVVSGGDSLNSEKNAEVNKFLRTHNAQTNIIQGYGMTETGGGVVIAGLGSDKLGSVGIPLPGNIVKIVDIDTKEECPYNKHGEIYISGPSVMCGYLDDEKSTNEILEADENGRIWVHTGDLGYLDEDGCLFFVSRIKRMLIVSGYNVYPSHIENVLMKHPAVLNCCVIGIPHPYKVQEPKAFIVLKEDYKLTAELKNDIREYLERNLAKYMIPKKIEYKNSLPKTMIGKVDFRKLSE